jgi:hypothetical protein
VLLEVDIESKQPVPVDIMYLFDLNPDMVVGHVLTIVKPAVRRVAICLLFTFPVALY